MGRNRHRDKRLDWQQGGVRERLMAAHKKGLHAPRIAAPDLRMIGEDLLITTSA
jgi:hypothetical protein